MWPHNSSCWLFSREYDVKQDPKWEFSWQLVHSAGEEKKQSEKSKSQQDSAEGERGDCRWMLLLFMLGEGESADFTFVASQ